MKKIIALALALVMMAAIAVPVFAASESFTADATLTNQTTVKYGVSQTYTVTIPETITISDAQATTAEVSASNVKIAGDKSLRLVVSSTQYDDENDTWVLIDQNKNEDVSISDPVDYMITYPVTVDETTTDTDVVSGTTQILVVSSKVVYDDETGDPIGNSGAVTLKFTTEGTSQVGDFQDKLTFSVTIS